MKIQDLSDETLAEGLEHIMKIEASTVAATKLARSVIQETINRLRDRTNRDETIARPFTPKEAGEALGISQSQLYRLMAEGELKSFKVGKSRRVPREEVEAYIKRQTHYLPSQRAGADNIYSDGCKG